MAPSLFDAVADLYDHVRPGYPEALIARLLSFAGAGATSAALEIGCGSGQATAALAPRLGALLALEPGERLAALARARFAGAPQVQIVNTTFEAWDSGGARFALIVAATSFHWIDPAVGLDKAAALLRPGGALALLFHTQPLALQDARCTAGIDRLYAALDPQAAPPPLPSAHVDWPARLAAHPAFDEVESAEHVWARAYTAAELRALFETFSPQQAMAPALRSRFLDSLEALVEQELGGSVERRWRTVLHLARRRPDS